MSGGAITAPVWNKVDGTQAACGTCHGLPPAGSHPAVGSATTGCATCHPETVNADGSLNLPGGKHVDGVLQVTGHGNYTSPAVHGPAFLDALAVNPAAPSCTGCHGLSYGGAGAAPSCNACHSAAGWSLPWQSNCSFCHGSRSTAARAGYPVLQHPTWAAPPDDVNGRLSGTNSAARTGAHQAHLSGVLAGGSSIAAPFACETCHALPSDLSHVDGSAARAVVALSGAGQASLPLALGSYDPASGNCTTYCHGSTLNGGSLPAPRWSITDGTQAACGACHGVPPVGGGHPFVSSAVTGCSVCHPDTMNANGTLNVAGGKHVDGVIQASGGHGDYTAPSVHAPRFFEFASGAPGALQCTLCHGADYGTPITPSGDSCNTCHQKAGWTGWTTNCSFCHGARSAQSQAGYSFAAHPGWAAPPDDLTGRLGGANVAARTGAHQPHLNGVSSSGASFALPFTCGTCHAVPADLSHISGASARAAVALVGTGQASLPSSLGTYSPASGTCTTYCHGQAASPAWGATGVVCGSCHALPPAASTGHPAASGLSSCATCHTGTMNPDGTLNVAGGKHLNGLIDVTGGHGDISLPSQHGPMFLDYLGGVPGALDCTTCHGAGYGTVITRSGDSCNTCHQKAGWTGWTTNCSFCHGTKSAQSQAGYAVNTFPTLSAPPADVQGRLNGSNLAARTGAHQAHLSGTTVSGQAYANPFLCATCHTVPGDLSHVGGSTSRATVALDAAGQASLPAVLGTYTQGAGTCATYCHGSSLSGGAAPAPAWSGSVTRCDACHGIPPDTGAQIFNSDYGFWASAHLFHTGQGIGFGCNVCHAATSTVVVQGGTPVNALLPNKAAHVNGTVDVVFSSGGTWNRTAGTCAPACHGGQTMTWR
jgi:predicted CxxxxCH...CXXCH cytochrome family protein